MPKNKKSHSRSNSSSRKHKHSKHPKHSRSRSREYDKKASKFSNDPVSKPIARKKESKWSDKPPEKADPQTNILFDAGIIKIDPGQTIPSSAITITNPGVPNVVINPTINPLQSSQKELFNRLLEKKEEEMAGHPKDINTSFSNTSQINSELNVPYNHNSAILAQAGITISNNLEEIKGPTLPNNNILTILNPGFSNMNTAPIFKHTPGINPNIINTLNDPSKIKRKIYVPQNSNFNYTGLIIGPKGANQKRLEEETGCKILVRGKGSQKEGQVPQPDDNEPQHVLVVGDTEMQVSKAVVEIERILFADEETRNKLRQEQLKIVAQLKNEPNQTLPLISLSEEPYKVDLSLTTPYGPPSQDAYIIPVPNDCVGLVIGKGGETIKMLQVQSGARKVQVAADSGPNSNTRNVFVEGDKESITKVKRMLQDIIDTQQKLKNALNGGGGKTSKLDVPVPDNLVGLIIGRGGETIKNINNKTGAFVFIPKTCEPGSNLRILAVSGLPDQIEMAKNEIEEIVNMGQKNIALKAAQLYPQQSSGGLNPMNPLNGGGSSGGIDQSQMNMMNSPAQFGNQFGYDMNNMMMNPLMQQSMFPPMYDPNLLASYQQQLAENQLVITDVVEDRPSKSYKKKK